MPLLATGTSVYLRAFKATERLRRFLQPRSEALATAVLGRYLKAMYGPGLSYESIAHVGSDTTQRWTTTEAASRRLAIVAVTYKQPAALACFLASLRCQTLQNFALTVLHDGSDEETRKVVAEHARAATGECTYIETESRFNDFGHSLRAIGIERSNEEFILLTNGDNYYAPRFVEYAFDAIDAHRLDLLMWNFVHSHGNAGGTGLAAYSPFSVYPIRLRIDMGSFMVRTALASTVGFRDKSHDGDATFFSDILQTSTSSSLRIGKIQKTLMVHN
jgi:Glycosyl transferase family 2